MKKILMAALSAAVALTMSPCAFAEALPEEDYAGSYTGVAQGLGGDVTVTITLDSKGVITEVLAEGPDETQGIGSVAIEEMPVEMVDANSVEVDGISGATVTSQAIIAAATSALAEAGLSPDDLEVIEIAETEAEDMVLEADVVIVGAGGAGLTAAVTACKAGSSVIVLESQNAAGGNSVRSTGGMNAADTPYQDENEFAEAAGVEKTLATVADEEALAKALDESVSEETVAYIKELAQTVQEQYDAYNENPEGYFDSVELMELDTMIGGHGTNKPELVNTLCEGTADAIEWLSGIGADLKNVGAFGGASVKRIHRPVDADGKVVSVGAYLVPILKENTDSLGIEVLYDTTATRILMADGKAVGVEAEGKSGNAVTVNAKSVILATGGFGANFDMIAEYRPDLVDYCTTNAAGAQGQGILMATAEDVGANTVEMDQIQIHPTVHVDEAGAASLITEGLRGDGAILVNANGERFYDEVSTRDKVSAAEIEQQAATGADYVWLVIDQAMADASGVIQGYISKGFTVTGESYEELAEAMGADPAVFAATMEAWNACVEAGEDTMLAENARTSFANPLDTAPFYALQVTPGVHHTMGGVEIDSAAEVLSTEGEVIPGLFAAGEVTGGVHGQNRLGGTAVADFVVYGRIAGQSAADYAAQ